MIQNCKTLGNADLVYNNRPNQSKGQSRTENKPRGGRQKSDSDTTSLSNKSDMYYQIWYGYGTGMSMR